MPRREPMKARNDKSMALLRDLLASHAVEDDLRLTPGQMHKIAVEELGCEQIAFA